ncbi:MAG: hypothetical protein AB7E95_02120 [Kiritimatiellales bacterium]
MSGRFGVLPKWIVTLFFWIGLSAAVCIRLLALITRWNPSAALWVWRFAMVCYIFFFGYRYLIGSRRRRIIQKYRLVDGIEQTGGMDETTRAGTLYILRSITRSKELFNYAFIFCLSLLALIIDLLFR